MRPALLRRAIILVALMSCGLLTGCGSSHSAHTGATTGTHAGANRPPVKTQALAFANAVNLTAADVPGFKASSAHEHEHETPAEKRLDHELQHCTGGSLKSSNGLAEVSSKDFKLEHGILDLSVSSEVSVSSVAPTPSQTSKELEASRSDHVRECLSHYLNLLFKGQKYQGATVSPVSISQGTPPAPGTSGSFGWRITVAITVHGIKLPFYLDILGFVYSRAEVSLLSSGVLRPFPAATQEQLFSLLLTRAKKHAADLGQ